MENLTTQQLEQELLNRYESLENKVNEHLEKYDYTVEVLIEINTLLYETQLIINLLDKSGSRFLGVQFEIEEGFVDDWRDSFNYKSFEHVQNIYKLLVIIGDTVSSTKFKEDIKEFYEKVNHIQESSLRPLNATLKNSPFYIWRPKLNL